jgi:ParB family chromosome partitioning protein
MVWSCSLFRLPEEDEAGKLEDRLRAEEGSFWDDAMLLRKYLRLTGLSQAACAKALGRSQSSVANRLRLLRLPEPVRERMRAAGLSERHARALLRLEGEKDLEEALAHVIRTGLNVAETEAYVERRLDRARKSGTVPREFEPLLTELERLRRSLPDVSYELAEEAGEIRFLIRIPKKSGDYL